MAAFSAGGRLFHFGGNEGTKLYEWNELTDEWTNQVADLGEDKWLSPLTIVYDY